MGTRAFFFFGTKSLSSFFEGIYMRLEAACLTEYQTMDGIIGKYRKR